MAATGSSYGFYKSHYEPPFEECLQLLMGYSTSRSRRLTPSALGLQLLVVRGDHFMGQFAKLSEELVWLRWYDFPHRKLPSWLSTGKLRVLELYEPNRLVELWGPDDAPPPQLRELIVDMSGFGNLQMIPKTIEFLKHLKKISLKGVVEGKGIEISSLPEEFCRLESLEHLELLRFPHLSSLPTQIGNLIKLKYIDLQGCQRLTALPVSFNQLTELQYLDLSRCMNLQLDKDILENITKLEKLRLGGCSKLQQFPSEITRKMYLRELRLSYTGMRELPADIDRLVKLEELEIGGHCLTSVPTCLGNLSSLIKLEIQISPKLKYLPSLENLSCLIKLRIVDCKVRQLLGVGSLTRLEDLELAALDLEYLPEGFRQLVNLQTLWIHNCPITEIPLANPDHVDSSMFKLPRLKYIDLSCTKVSTISISEDCCPSLEHLEVWENDDLMEIEILPTNVKSLQISACRKLKNIRCVEGLAKLHSLVICTCRGLEKLPSFAGLVELQRLKIEDCSRLHELPSFACCTCLQELEIEVSNRITKIEGLEQLRSLETLTLDTYWKVPRYRRFKKPGQIGYTENCGKE